MPSERSTIDAEVEVEEETGIRDGWIDDDSLTDGVVDLNDSLANGAETELDSAGTETGEALDATRDKPEGFVKAYVELG